MWFEKDYRWMLPSMGILILGMIVFTNWPKSSNWYDSQEDRQINPIKVEELANWIIQGRNDFVPVSYKLHETNVIDNIPGLLELNPEGKLSEQVQQIPLYKKLVVIPQNGEFPSEVLAVLTANWQRKVILLEGGAETWNTRITADSIESLLLTLKETEALTRIRPFFHRALLESAELEKTQQDRYVAPLAVSPPLLEEEEEEEEEEGC
jgi:hypothetical protein